MMEFHRKLRGAVPWGWSLESVDPNLPRHLVPVKEQQDALQEAFGFLDGGASLRETSRWLSYKTKRYMSFVTLRKLHDEARATPRAV